MHVCDGIEGRLAQHNMQLEWGGGFATRPGMEYGMERKRGAAGCTQMGNPITFSSAMLPLTRRLWSGARRCFEHLRVPQSEEFFVQCFGFRRGFFRYCSNLYSFTLAKPSSVQYRI